MSSPAIDPSYVIYEDPGWIKVVELSDGSVVIARSSVYRLDSPPYTTALSEYTTEDMVLVDSWTEHHDNWWVGQRVIFEVWGTKA